MAIDIRLSIPTEHQIRVRNAFLPQFPKREEESWQVYVNRYVKEHLVGTVHRHEQGQAVVTAAEQVQEDDTIVDSS